MTYNYEGDKKNNQSGSGINTRKLDESNDAGKHTTINSNIKQLIINLLKTRGKILMLALFLI